MGPEHVKSQVNLRFVFQTMRSSGVMFVATNCIYFLSNKIAFNW